MALNERVKMTSEIVYLIDFDVVREKVSPFSCYRKDNYTVKYPKLIEPLFPNSQFFLTEEYSIYIYIEIFHSHYT